MRRVLQFTAVIEREGDGYVATCPELVVSQGVTIEEARRNLLEAVEGFLEVASPSEIRRRMKKGKSHGTNAGAIRGEREGEKGWCDPFAETVPAVAGRPA
jgi:predicted RNase H-like HicB family nuclease